MNAPDLWFSFQLIKTRVGNDRYVERGMNTFNNPPKLKGIQTTRIGFCVSRPTAHIRHEDSF